MNEGQNNGDSAQTLTVDSAATMLEGLLSGDTEEQQPETHEDDKTPAAQSSTEDEGEEPESTEQSPSEEEESEQGEEPGEDESDEEEEQPQLIAVKVNGEERKVTLDELRKGYSREADYTQKSQKLAEERRRHETEVAPERDALRAERQRYASQLNDLETTMKALVQEPDWEALRQTSPDLFADTWAAWQEHQKAIARITDERNKAVEVVQKDAHEQLKTQLAGERDKLLTAIPAWSDKDVAKRESDEILAYGKTLGFDENEIRGVSDHRALVTLRKAMLFDRAQVDKAKATKNAQAKIEKVKVAKPGSKGGSAKVTDATRARQRHAQLGSVDSAAAALQLMLED